jgi:hypothetical protein
MEDFHRLYWSYAIEICARVSTHVTQKLDAHPFSAIHFSKFNIFTATFRIWRAFFRPQAAVCHTVVTENRVTWKQPSDNGLNYVQASPASTSQNVAVLS